MNMIRLLNYWADLKWQKYRMHIGIYVLLAVIFSLLGPFGTFDEPSVWRFVYWFTMLGLFGGIILPLAARSVRGISFLKDLNIVPGTALLVCLSALPMTIIVAITDIGLYNFFMSVTWLPFYEISEIRSDIDPPVSLVLTEVVNLYASVLTIVLISAGLVSLIVAYRYKDIPQPSILAVTPGAAFFSRLPDRIGTDLIYLQMEDHYLRVVTQAGEDLILMRFRDAIRELETYGGLQVHRSWWVVSTEIKRLSRSGRKIFLIMSNGSKVPVSSSFKKTVEDLLSVPETKISRAPLL